MDDATGMITDAYFDLLETLRDYYHVYAQMLRRMYNFDALWRKMQNRMGIIHS